MFSAKKMMFGMSSSSGWSVIGSRILGGVDERSGESLSLSSSGDVVAIGSPGSGVARVFVWNGSSWVQRGSDIVGKEPGDDNGFGVSINGDGTVVAVGARLALPTETETGRGIVRVFVWDGSSWLQRGSDIVGEIGENLGWSVGISTNGTVVAAGCPSKNRSSTTWGCAKVYFWGGSSWIQRGSDIVPNSGGPQGMGRVLSLSGDGSVVAFGDNQTNSGRVPLTVVYAWNGSSWVKRGVGFGGSLNSTSGGRALISKDGLVLCAEHTVYVWGGSGWTQRGGRPSGQAFESIRAVNQGGDFLVTSYYDGDSDSYRTSGYFWLGSSWVKHGETLTVGSGSSLLGGYAMSSDGDVFAVGRVDNWVGGVSLYRRV